MARAAVKARQQAAAKAQPPKSRARGRRRHSGGGNPNQELFFVRLRRHQKWVYAVLAVIFGLSFIFVGVGSGAGGGLSQLYDNIFGGSGGSSISKASALVKKNPAAGYRQLSTAYEEAGHPALAVIALQQYLQLKKTDANSWSELAGLEQTQGSTYAAQYQSAQQQAQSADPSASFLPGGTLGSAAGTNPVYQDATTAAQSRESLLYQKAVGAYTSAVTDFQKASRLHPRNTSYLQQLAQAAITAGNSTVATHALRAYLRVYPNAPDRKQVAQEIRSLEAQARTSSP
jgi:tetratricopeptide (TPR) repeat protein